MALSSCRPWWGELECVPSSCSLKTPKKKPQYLPSFSWPPCVGFGLPGKAPRPCRSSEKNLAVQGNRSGGRGGVRSQAEKGNRGTLLLPSRKVLVAACTRFLFQGNAPSSAWQRPRCSVMSSRCQLGDLLYRQPALNLGARRRPFERRRGQEQIDSVIYRDGNILLISAFQGRASGGGRVIGGDVRKEVGALVPMCGFDGQPVGARRSLSRRSPVRRIYLSFSSSRGSSFLPRFQHLAQARCGGRGADVGGGLAAVIASFQGGLRDGCLNLADGQLRPASREPLSSRLGARTVSGVTWGTRC